MNTEDIRARHTPARDMGGEEFCVACQQYPIPAAWPCDAIRAADEVDRLRAQLEFRDQQVCTWIAETGVARARADRAEAERDHHRQGREEAQNAISDLIRERETWRARAEKAEEDAGIWKSIVHDDGVRVERLNAAIERVRALCDLLHVSSGYGEVLGVVRIADVLRALDGDS